MSVNSKAFAKPKMTKRQRKAAKGPNMMVLRCMEKGQKIGEYVGANPEFTERNFGTPDLPVWRQVKTAPGIPFVRPDNFTKTRRNYAE